MSNKNTNVTAPSRMERELLTRRKEIIDAAERLFLSRGFLQTRMEEIAREAQFSRRTLYHYFRSKDDLYMAVLLRYQTEKNALTKAVLESDGSHIERMYRFGEEYYQYFRKNPDFLRFQLHMDTGQINYLGLSPEYSAEYERGTRELFEVFGRFADDGCRQGVFRLDLNIGTLLPQLFFGLRAVICRAVLEPESTRIIRNGTCTPDEFYRRYLEVMIRGMLK